MAAVSLLDRIRRSGCTVGPRDQNVTADKDGHDALSENGIEPTRRRPGSGWTPRLEDMSEELGISGVALAAILVQLGLRKNKEPTERARVEGYAQRRYNGYSISIDWHVGKVIDLVLLIYWI